jgi:hypothetical protein
VVALRPAQDRPALVATTAHIGMGVLDVTEQEWDEAKGRLTLGLSPAGRRTRSIYVADGGRRVERALLDGTEVAVAVGGGCARVEVEADAAATLQLDFA